MRMRFLLLLATVAALAQARTKFGLVNYFGNSSQCSGELSGATGVFMKCDICKCQPVPCRDDPFAGFHNTTCPVNVPPTIPGFASVTHFRNRNCTDPYIIYYTRPAVCSTSLPIYRTIISFSTRHVGPDSFNLTRWFSSEEEPCTGTVLSSLVGTVGKCENLRNEGVVISAPE